jgi:hypothetical protein
MQQSLGTFRLVFTFSIAYETPSCSLIKDPTQLPCVGLAYEVQLQNNSRIMMNNHHVILNFHLILRKNLSDAQRKTLENLLLFLDIMHFTL